MSYCGQCGAALTGRFCGLCGAVAEIPGDTPGGTGMSDAPGGSAYPAPSVPPPTAWSPPPIAPPQPPVPPPPPPQASLPHPTEWPPYTDWPPSTAPVQPPAPPLAPVRRSVVPWIISAAVVVVMVSAVGVVAVMRGWIPLGQSSSPASAVPAPSQFPLLEPIGSASAQPTAGSTVGTVPSPAITAPRGTAPTVTAPTVASTSNPGQRLSEQRYADIASLSLNGRWIAQLSSKYDGVTDSTQVAGNGTHTFYLDDILIEHQALRTGFTSAGARIYLLAATDFGKQRTWPGTLWVTIADPGLSSQSQVQQWCQTQFPQLSGKQLENVCMARQLNPPSR